MPSYVRRYLPHISEQIARDRDGASWALAETRNKAVIGRVVMRAREQAGVHPGQDATKDDFAKVDFGKLIDPKDGDRIAQDLFETRVKRGAIAVKPTFR